MTRFAAEQRVVVLSKRLTCEGTQGGLPDDGYPSICMLATPCGWHK